MMRPHAFTVQCSDVSEEASSNEPSPPIRYRSTSSDAFTRTGLGQWYERRLRVLLDMGWLREEVTLTWKLLFTIVLGSIITYAAWCIPYVPAELVGVGAILTGVGLFAIMVLRRVRQLEMMPLLALPALFLIFLNYINLAEAVDKDSYSLALEDALEVAVETNVYDRYAARWVMASEMILVAMLFVLAEGAFTLSRCAAALTVAELRAPRSSHAAPRGVSVAGSTAMSTTARCRGSCSSSRGLASIRRHRRCAHHRALPYAARRPAGSHPSLEAAGTPV